MNQRKKDFAAGAGWMLNIVMIATLGVFVWYCNQPDKEHGYTIAHRAELQAKFDNLVPLSIADLGEDYE
jgi:Na+-transporting NADH:ubiquinone oxidoreductase subunit NqrE